MPQVPSPTPVDLATFEDEARYLASVYEEVNGVPPAPSDMAFHLWRRNTEWWTIRDIEYDIRNPGTPADQLPDGGMGGAAPRPSARRGSVTTEGRNFRDDDGAFFPLGCTLFYGPSGWANQGGVSQQQVKDNLDYLADNGFHYTRVIYSLYDTPIEALAEFIDYAYEEFGLRTQITVFGGSWDGVKRDPLVLTDRVNSISGSRTERIIIREAANEFYNVGVSIETVKEMTRRLSTVPGLFMSTCPTRPNLDDPETNVVMRETMWYPGQVGSWHPDRTNGDKNWRFVRQAYDARNWSWPTKINEPIGPASSVNYCYEPVQLAQHRASSILYGCGAYVLHNASGISGIAHTHQKTGQYRPANLWEMKNIGPITEAVKRIVTFLPPDLPNWDGDVPHVFSGVNLWPPDSEGINKAHTARNGKRFVYLANGVWKTGTFKANDNVKKVTFYTIDGNDPVDERSVAKGETFTLPGREDTLKAYIGIGEIQ